MYFPKLSLKQIKNRVNYLKAHILTPESLIKFNLLQTRRIVINDNN